MVYRKNNSPQPNLLGGGDLRKAARGTPLPKRVRVGFIRGGSAQGLLCPNYCINPSKLGAATLEAAFLTGLTRPRFEANNVKRKT